MTATASVTAMLLGFVVVIGLGLFVPAPLGRLLEGAFRILVGRT